MRFTLLILAALFHVGAVRGQDLRTGLPTPVPAPEKATAPAMLSVGVGPGSAPASAAVSLTAAQVAALKLDTVSYADPDVVAAAVAFATLDPRYQELAPESYYGARLEAVHKRIATEGLTPVNKAELLAVYQGATAALRAFIVAHPQ